MGNSRTHTHTPTHTLASTHIQAHAHVPACMHAHKHAHTQVARTPHDKDIKSGSLDIWLLRPAILFQSVPIAGSHLLLIDRTKAAYYRETC